MKLEEATAPSSLNVYDYFDKFENSTLGIYAIKSLKKEISAANVGRISGILVVVLGFIMISVQFWGLVLIILGAIGFFYQKTRVQNSELAYNQSIGQHTLDVVNSVLDTKYKGDKGFYYNQEGLIYGPDGCAFIDLQNGKLVLLEKQNIKEVTRERKLVGTQNVSTTTGRSRSTVGTAIGVNPFGSRKIKATTNTETVAQYEWHLDILSNFNDYPLISMTIPDIGNWEKLVGQAYATLKP